MRSIFLCGQSGVGKTVFCDTLSQEFGIPIKKEVTRKNDDILNTTFATRQTYFLLNYITRHFQSNMDSFISDRSIFDYIFWTLYSSNHDFDFHIEDFFINQLMEIKHIFHPEDIFIIVPAPKNIELYAKIILPNFIKDEFRMFIYTEKYINCYNMPPRDFNYFNNFIFTMGLKMEECLLEMVKKLDVQYINPNYDEDNYFSWQDKALVALKSLTKKSWLLS